MSEILVVRSLKYSSSTRFKTELETIHDNLVEQLKTGVVVIPSDCAFVTVLQGDSDIQFMMGLPLEENVMEPKGGMADGK